MSPTANGTESKRRRKMIEVKTMRELIGPGIDRGLQKLWERETGKDSSALSPDEQRALIASKRREIREIRRKDEERRKAYLLSLSQGEGARPRPAARSDVPPRFSQVSLEELDEEVRRISSLILRGRSGVVIGAPGTGKTTMAWATAVALRERKPGLSVAVETLSCILSSVRSGDDWMNSINRKYGSYDVLFIDEAGKNRSSDSEYELIFSLINYRYEMMRQTVVLGNLESTGKVVEALGESSFSRLTGDGGFMATLGSGADKRRQNAARKVK